MLHDVVTDPIHPFLLCSVLDTTLLPLLILPVWVSQRMYGPCLKPSRRFPQCNTL